MEESTTGRPSTSATSFPGPFPWLGAGREKALPSDGHVPSLHPKILGVASVHNHKCENHDGGETVCAFRLGSAQF